MSFDELAIENTTNNLTTINDDDDDDDIFLFKDIPEEEEYMQYIKKSIILNKDFNPLDY